MKVTLLPLLLALAPLPLIHAQSDVLYRETFENDTGADRTLSEVGWRMLLGDEASDFTKFQPTNRTHGPNFRGGSNRSLEAVNSTPTSDDFAVGYLGEEWGEDWNRPALYYTDEHPIDTAEFQIEQISWLQGAGPNPVKIAIRVGDDQWVVSKDDFVGGNNAYFLPTGGEEFVMEFQSAEWLELDVKRGSLMELKGPQPLPTGEITAFGWYLPEGKEPGTSVAFDDFTISGSE